MMNCPTCNEALDSSATSCSACGAVLASVPPPPPPAPVAAGRTGQTGSRFGRGVAVGISATLGVLAVAGGIVAVAMLLGDDASGAVVTMTFEELVYDVDERSEGRILDFRSLEPGDRLALRARVFDAVEVPYEEERALLLEFNEFEVTVLDARAGDYVAGDFVEMRLTITRESAEGYEFEWFAESLGEPFGDLVLPASVVHPV